MFICSLNPGKQCDRYYPITAVDFPEINEIYTQMKISAYKHYK